MMNSVGKKGSPEDIQNNGAKWNLAYKNEPGTQDLSMKLQTWKMKLK